MKKSADAEKKIVEKRDKAKAKNQTLEIKQLALSNRQAEAQLGSFKDILLDLPTGDKLFQPSNNSALVKDPQLSPTGLTSILYIATQLKNVQKKKATKCLLFD